MSTWQKDWHRHFWLRYFYSLGEQSEGLGPPDSRFLVPRFRYDPLEYAPLGQSWSENSEIVLDQLPPEGLDFYTYVGLDSCRVRYEDIQSADHFGFEAGCASLGLYLYLPCTILPPPTPTWAIHQIDDNAGWGTGLASLALPIALRLLPDQIQSLRDFFETNHIGSLILNLSYSFHADAMSVEKIGGRTYLGVGPERSYSRSMPHFFVVRPSASRPVRVMVASDLHVSDRADNIPTVLGEIGPRYCNYNEQARTLAQRALDDWKAGLLDYVVLNGDLIDFALRDSVQGQVNLYPSPALAERPMPYGLGEHFFNVSTLLSTDCPVLTSPDDADNPQRAEDLLESLAPGFEDQYSNWRIFTEIFQEMLSCVPTHLTPGNHDYLLVGPPMEGLTPEEYHRFVDELEGDGLQGVGVQVVQIAAGLLTLHTLGFVDLDATAPPYEKNDFYHSTGLTHAEACDYDATRKFKSNYPALIAVLQDPGALAASPGMYPTEDARSFRIRQDEGDVRLAFFDTGPNWNFIENSSPFLVGFRSPGHGAKHKALQRLAKWRDDPLHDHETLVCFGHAPLVSRWDTTHSLPPSDDYALFHRVEGDSIAAQHRVTGLGDGEEYADLTQYGIFKHGWLDFLLLAIPRIDLGVHDHSHPDPGAFLGLTIATRSKPFLMFGGHTHFRHTYSLTRIISSTSPPRPTLDSLRCMHYQRGNGLLDELNNANSDASVRDWWKGRALVLHTGCVGPIPPAANAPGVAVHPFVLPSPEEAIDNQGYYVMTLERGVVRSIEWRRMAYNA